MRARGPRGKRVVGKTPHGHWKILSTIAAMTADGMLTGCTFDGATDTAMFLAFVEHFLMPHLTSGQVVVLDNLPAHRSPQVDRLIGSAGARVLRLPAYSPDLNPIEMAIAQIKALLRKLARRQFDGLVAAIGEAMTSISRADPSNFIRH